MSKKRVKANTYKCWAVVDRTVPDVFVKNLYHMRATAECACRASEEAVPVTITDGHRKPAKSKRNP